MAVKEQSRARVLYRLPEQRRFGASGLPRLLTMVLLGLVLFLGGLVVGRASMTRATLTAAPSATSAVVAQVPTAPSVAASPQTTAVASQAGGPVVASEAGGAAVGRVGPRRVEHGVGVGWAPSRGGAVAAAANYTKVLSSALILDTARRRLAIDTLAAPEAAPRLQKTFDQAVASLRKGLGVTGPADQAGGVLLRAVPVGWRVEQYGGGAAKVAIWVTSVAGSLGGPQGSVPVREGWGTTTVSVRWVGGDWNLLDITTEDGPVPIADVSPPTAAAELVDQASQFKEFHHAPGS